MCYRWHWLPRTKSTLLKLNDVEDRALFSPYLSSGGGGLKAIIEHCKCMYRGTFKESCQAIAIISIAHISTIHERMWNVLQPSQWVNWVPFHYIELVVWDIRGGFSATLPWCFSTEGGGVAHKFSLTRGGSSLRKILGGCCAYNIGIKLRDLSCCLQKIGLS